MLDELVGDAQKGDASALDELVRQLKEPLFGLALRMLYYPQDAEDALQEILIKIITHIGSFEYKSTFKTYAFRIAVNHLRTIRCRMREFPDVSFDELSGRIKTQQAIQWQEDTTEAQQNLFVREIRLRCLQALLLALDREHRLAYILGEIIELTGEQAAEILNLKPATFRKRLSRARHQIREFMLKYCAIIRPDNACRCNRQAAYYTQLGEISSHKMGFAIQPHSLQDDSKFMKRLGELEEIHRVGNLFKACPDLTAPDKLVSRIRDMVSSGKYDLLGA